MKLYVWRHNRRYHSWSMLEEPCVHQAFYHDAIAVVLANSQEEALRLLAGEGSGWLVEELRRLTPSVIELNQPRVIFQEARGD